jgi:hypothetical protein
MKRGLVSKDVLTLGQVAESERFKGLRELIESVKGTPVNQLSDGLCSKLLLGEDKQTQVLLEAFFAACKAVYKRVHLDSEHSSGKSRIFLFFP